MKKFNSVFRCFLETVWHLPGTTTGAITAEDIFGGRFKSGIVDQGETLVNCLI
jgi:hypothetical protein